MNNGNAEERRNQIKSILAGAGSAVSAAALAERLGVSRQIIVGDIALLRAAGCEIEATARGYVDRSSREEKKSNCCKVVCQHQDAETEKELQIFVDNGCKVIDVTVEHPVYGQLTGLLNIASRYDIKCFLQKVAQSEAHSLCELTDGIHLHTIEYPDEETLKRTLGELRESGILYEESI